MKFKHLLLTLLLAAFMPWTANAQTTETIGTGTSETTYVFPGNYKYQYSVFLYRPNAVAVCLNNDFDLSSIAYDVVDYYSATIDELTFWVKDVDESDYENQGYLWNTNTFSHYIEGATQVYSTQTSFNLTEGWNTFNFTTDFSHQAGKALLVAVRGVCNNNSSSYNPKCHCHFATDGYSVWYKGSMSTTDPGLDTPGYSISTDRANIQLGVTYSSTFPSDLTVTYPTCNDTEVTLGWTENGEATAWQICLNDDETNLIAANTNPFTLTNLTPETPYTAKVRANYGSTQSSWSSPVSFIPTFKTIIGTGGEVVMGLPCEPGKKYSLTQQIYTPAELGTAADIASIDFYNNGNKAATRNLQIYMTHTDQNEFLDWLNDDWIGVASGDLVFSGTVNFVKDAWTNIVLDTPFSYNGTQNVVITVDDNTGTAPNVPLWGDYLFLCYNSQSNQTKIYYGYDNYDPTNNPGDALTTVSLKNHIRVLKIQPPTELTASNITSESATLSWTDNGCATAWQICLNGDETNLIDVTSNPYTLTNLTQNTTYTAKVRADYGIAHNDWTNEVNFTTQESCPTPTNLTAGNIDPYTADLSWTGLPEVESYTVTYKPVPILYEDFENFAGFGDGEDDWTNSNHCVFVGGNSLVQGLPGSMKCCVLGCEISFLISPELPTDGLTLEFYYKIRNSDYPVIFQVGFSSTDKDIASFTFGDEIPYGDSEWHLHTTGVPTGTKYICWKTSNTTYIDDIMVYPDGYDAASEWQTQSVAGNAYQVGATLTGLAPANLYEAYVYPDCNPDKESDRLHFMTEDPCASPGNFTVGNVGTTTADLSWTGSPYTESFTVQYRTLPFFSEGFENGIGDWTLTDCHEYSCVTSSLGGHLSRQLFRFYFDSNQSGQQPQYLISPELTGLVQGMKLEFYYRRIVEGEGTDAFQVGFSTTDNQPESFTFDDEIDVFDYSWHLYSKRIPAGTKYICWKYNPSNDNAIHHVLIDDIVIGMETPVGRWQTATVAGNAAEVSTTLTGLTSSSPYEAYVYPDCNPDKISQPVYFTTEEDPCYLPFNLTVNNITYTTANLSWTAATEVDSYTLKYRVNDTLFFEGFENGIGDWTMFNYASNTGISHGAHSGFVGFLFYHDNNPPQYLISPELTGVGEGIRLEFYYRYWGYMETFQVGFSATDNATESFTFGDTITVSDEQWHLYSETIPAGTKYICWKDNSYRQIGLSIDDVVIGTIGNWQTVTVPGNAAEANATLTGLMPGGIQYEAFVYPDCNPDKVSETVLFRTIDDCPRPDNLTVGTVGITTADLNWTGNPEVESYTVKYKRLRNIAFSEGFEDGIGDWTRRNCIYASDVYYFYGAHSGIAGFQFYYNTNPPQYLISPELTGVGKGMRLEFYYQNERIFPETFQVGFSATDNATESFTFGDTITASDGQWHFYSETIPAGTKYICWKHISNGQHSLSIDDIVVGSEIPDGDWQTATVAGNSTDVSTTLTGLMPGTNYKAYVYPECNPIKVSETMCFTTTEVCQTPTNFSVGYVSPTTAELSWSASHYMDSYTVKYKIRGNVFTEGFENGLGDWTIAQEWSFTGVGTDAAHSGSYGFMFEHHSKRLQYLFSPELTGITEGMKLEFYYKNWGEGVPETFQVGFSSTDNVIESFTFGDEITVSDAQWHLYSASIPAGTKYICFKYLTTGDWFLYLDDISIGVDSQWQTVTVEGNTDEVSTTLTGLMPATSYEVYVYPDCDPELVSETLLFNTIEDCPRPENLTASYVGATTANLSWTGVPEEESYTMEYREASTVFSEGFENGIGNWTLRDCGNNTGIMTFDGGIAYFRFNHSYFAQYLISPELSGISDGMKLEFEYYIPGNSTYSETFQIGLSSTDNATESFTFGDEITVSSGQYFTYSEPIPVGTKFICWKYTSNMQALNIDNIVVGLDTPAGPWQTATVAGGTVEVSASITGLSPETSYEVHVYPECDPNKVSESVFFMTLEQTTVTQTIALQTGWNWVSIYVDIALNDLRAALVEALPGTVITIKQQNGTTSYDPARHRWTGNITWDLSQMYEIKITANCEITLEGARISPSEHTVTIKSGNNWIAFPFDTSMSVTNAFAGFAVNGDMIKSKDGTTTYTRGRWVGTSLTTLEPGKGYVYKSAVSSDRTFSFPTGSK